MALKPGKKLLNGKYHIIRLIDRGGFGFVYEARDAVLDEPVAIKEMIPALINDAELTRRFILEAQATIHLRHHNIVSTRDVFQEDDNYYIVMECMSGGSLHDYLERRGRMEVNVALGIMRQVCAGLGYAHERGVVHCDLKPANILFTAQGEAKVADFGIAHVSSEMVSRSWHTATHFTAGTLLYMSPEQIDGVRDDARVDVYALGALLYQMLTGQFYLPFMLPIRSITDQMRNIELIQVKTPQPPRQLNPQVPAWLDEVVMRALQKDRANRYANAKELGAALSGAPESTGEHAARGALALVGEGRVWELPEGVTLIGRSSRADIQLADSRVSRHHAQIRRRGMNIAIMDVGSAAGTFVNGRRLAANQATPIYTGDVLSLAGTNLEIQRRTTVADHQNTPIPTSIYSGATRLGTPPVVDRRQSNAMMKPTHLKWWWALGGAAAAVVIVVGILFALGGGGGKETPTPTQTSKVLETSEISAPTVTPRQQVAVASAIVEVQTVEMVVTNTPAPAESVDAGTGEATATARPTWTAIPSRVIPPTVPGATSAPTATPQAEYPAPQLATPPDGEHIGTTKFPFAWTWSGQLATDEYFDVRVWQKVATKDCGPEDGGQHWGKVWTKERNFELDLEVAVGASGEYCWAIAVVRGTPGQAPEAILSAESAARRFVYSPPAGKPEPGGDGGGSGSDGGGSEPPVIP